VPTLFCKDADATRALGARLGARLGPGDVLALEGDLGAGKTELIRGVLCGLGGTVEAQSPTFTIVNHYPAPTPLFHADLYRVNSPLELQAIGLEEYLYGEGVCAVEWFSLCPQLLPKRYLAIQIDFAEEGARRVTLSAVNDPRLAALAEELAA
jgi:tRNA threonylcarbamoyladenosine biosynthesis protein TsaE